MLIEDLINELQQIKEKNGNIEVYTFFDEINEGFHLCETIFADVHYEDDKKEFFIETLEEGCRCLSCWERRIVEKPFVVLS